MGFILLSFSFNACKCLQWNWWSEFGECFLWNKKTSLYPPVWTSAWLRHNLFISWALLALTISLETLLGSATLFCHTLVHTIHGCVWVRSTCLCKVIPSVKMSVVMCLPWYTCRVFCAFGCRISLLLLLVGVIAGHSFSLSFGNR